MINNKDKRELQKLKYSLNSVSNYIDNVISSKSELDLDTRYYIHKEVMYPLYSFAQGTKRKEIDKALMDENEEDVIQKCIDGETNYQRRLIHYSPDVEYSFSAFRNGYKFVIPFLCSRNSTSVKIAAEKKFVNQIFESLILLHQEEITPLNEATLIIVSYAPDATAMVDNDNADLHDIINLIKIYLLITDDRGEYLDIAIKSCVGNQFFTELYILPNRNIVFPL